MADETVDNGRPDGPSMNDVRREAVFGSGAYTTEGR